MESTSLLPADTYIVANQTILNDQDRKLLITLYQPIIGTSAISLYFSFGYSLSLFSIWPKIGFHTQSDFIYSGYYAFANTLTQKNMLISTLTTNAS